MMGMLRVHVVWVTIWVTLGCGNPEPAARVAAQPKAVDVAKEAVPAVVKSRCGASTPVAACTANARACASGEERTGEWRYALVAGSFEPTQDLERGKLVERWRSGAIAAAPETEVVLAAILGDRKPVALDATSTWAIVPAHELDPRKAVVRVDGKHPLVGDGPLVVPLCGSATRNIDPKKLTTLVMSGTTAMTGRTAERIESHGIADIVKFIKPFFASADLVHISNEVSFVRRCKPLEGQDTLVFCSKDSYIGLLEALNTKIVELTGSHLTDHGERSLARTIRMYDERGWIHYGGGRTQVEATSPRFVEHNGNRLAFVGCNAVNTWVRRVSRGLGTASCDYARMAWQIQDLRRRGFMPIATVQHRELRTHAPPPDLVKALRGLAEAGAAFVLGSQAHVAHPWDVHYGAYLHYGPGNLLFAQHREVQREASADKVYIYENRILTVGHIFVRTEHGQPRLLRDDERADFLAAMATAAAEIAPPKPDAKPDLPPIARERPDSLVVRGRNQYLEIVAPESLGDGAKYPLHVDVEGTLQPSANAFYVKPVGKPYRTERATGLEIADFMRAKYPIDPKQTSITPEPTRRELRRHKRKQREAQRSR
jgi:poly-gamma-glutamate synthesis protein (capsule biosynthesis protein)